MLSKATVSALPSFRCPPRGKVCVTVHDHPPLLFGGPLKAQVPTQEPARVSILRQQMTQRGLLDAFFGADLCVWTFFRWPRPQ